MIREINYIPHIAQALKAGHATIMVGSGFSRYADPCNGRDCDFLSWDQRIDCFYEKLYGNEGDSGKNYIDPFLLTDQLEQAIGRTALEEILRQLIADQQYAPTELFQKLMELPWRDVFTTNYDTLLEKAASHIPDRECDVITSQDDLIRNENISRLIKLYGSFTSNRPYVITGEDYSTYPELHAPMLNTVRQAFLENTFLMIGYSVNDPDFLKWTEWIMDFFSKSSPRKLYMIAESHVAEPQSTILFKKNIIVVELEKIWKEDGPKRRLEKFLDALV